MPLCAIDGLLHQPAEYLAQLLRDLRIPLFILFEQKIAFAKQLYKCHIYWQTYPPILNCWVTIFDVINDSDLDMRLFQRPEQRADI